MIIKEIKKLLILLAILFCLIKGANCFLDLNKPVHLESKIDVNKATEQQLEAIPLVGKAKAKDILDYIKQHVKIKDINELDNIKGIGVKTFKELEEHLEVR